MSEFSLASVVLMMRKYYRSGQRSVLLALADLSTDPVDAAFAAQRPEREAKQAQAERHSPPQDQIGAAALAHDQCTEQEADQPSAQTIHDHLNEHVAPGAILRPRPGALRHPEMLATTAIEHLADARLVSGETLAAGGTAKLDHRHAPTD